MWSDFLCIKKILERSPPLVVEVDGFLKESSEFFKSQIWSIHRTLSVLTEIDNLHVLDAYENGIWKK